jgi:hypothetical protein
LSERQRYRVWRAGGKQEVEHGSEGIQVGLAINSSHASCFGRYIRSVTCTEVLGDSEVGYLHRQWCDGIWAGDKQVRGLDVAVDHPLFVCVLEPGGYLAYKFARLGDRQGTALPDESLQIWAIHVLEHQVKPVMPFVRIVNGDDVRVSQLGRGPCSGMEPLPFLGSSGQLRGQNLDCHRPVHGAMLCFVHAPHRPAADLFQHCIPAKEESVHAAGKQAVRLEPCEQSGRHKPARSVGRGSGRCE